jgi:hypothetical protein
VGMPVPEHKASGVGSELNEYETINQLMHAGNNMGSAVVHTYLI